MQGETRYHHTSLHRMPTLYWYQDEALFLDSKMVLEQALIVLLKDGLRFYSFATVDHMKAAAFTAKEENDFFF